MREFKVLGQSGGFIGLNLATLALLALQILPTPQLLSPYANFTLKNTARPLYQSSAEMCNKMHNASVLAAHFSPRPFGQLLGEEDGKGLFGVRLHNEVSCEGRILTSKETKRSHL